MSTTAWAGAQPRSRTASPPGQAIGAAAMPPLGVAIVGCGFVADYYMATLRAHPALRLAGVYDRDPERQRAFCAHHRVRGHDSLAALLAAPDVELVLNLTNPASHAEVSRAALEAGRHVYSEKPLALDAAEAAALAELAERQGLLLAAAPCSLLGETAQTMWKALQEGAIGRVRLAYANLDDGMLHRLGAARWRSASGAPWPLADELETGCTMQHAGYVLTWLAAFFGPARRVHAFSACCIPQKGIALARDTPDFSVGCLEFDGNIVARVTCGIVAPADRSLTIVGDEGVLYVLSVRDDAAPVYWQRLPRGRVAAHLSAAFGAVQARLGHALGLPFGLHGLRLARRYPYARRPRFLASARNKPVDFLRGPEEAAEAIRTGRPCRLSARLGVHVTELVETLQYPGRFGPVRELRSTFEPIAPLPWGR